MNLSRFAVSVVLLAATAAAQGDFSSFSLGSIDGQFGWTVRDAFTACTTVGTYDQGIVLDGSGNKVFRLSNAVTNNGYSAQVCSPSAAQVAGETGSALWNDRGTNGCAPVSPPMSGAYASNDAFWYRCTFRSATGAAQPGLFVTMSPTARQSTVRMGWIRIEDNGSTGFDLKVYDLLANGTFPAGPTTIATGLSYTAQHELTVTIDFVDGVSTVGADVFGNDVLKVYLDGTLIHTGSTWESYYYFYEQIVAGTPRKQAVDSMLFRVINPAVASTFGQGLYFGRSRIENDPPPVPVSLYGFGQPVDMPPTLNAAKAGRVIPLKFRVTDGAGMGVQVPNLTLTAYLYPLGSTPSGADEIELYAPGSTGLMYLGDGYYQYNWQTLKAWANSSRALDVVLSASGYTVNPTTLTALFAFKK